MFIQDIITLGKLAYKERHLLKKTVKGSRFIISSPGARSISAISNDATYFFQIAASENLKPDEVVMIMRAAERSYALFTRTAFMLIPAVEVENFDNSTIKDYLDQFHSNMGLRHDFSVELQLNSACDFNDSILNEATRVVLKNNRHTTNTDVDVEDTMRFGAGNLGYKDTGKPIQTQNSVRTAFSDLDWKKANDMLPSSVMVPVKFISKDTNTSHIVDVMVNIKAVLHKVTSVNMVQNIVSTIAQKKSLLGFVKLISGEERSVADFLFGISQMKEDLVSKANPWLEAFKRRKRLADMAWGTLKNNFMPTGTICLTMNEVNTLKQKYDIDVIKDSDKIMREYFLLGLMIADQSNEELLVKFDGYMDFQQYPYKTLEREAASQDKTIKDLIKTLGTFR